MNFIKNTIVGFLGLIVIPVLAISIMVVPGYIAMNLGFDPFGVNSEYYQYEKCLIYSFIVDFIICTGIFFIYLAHGFGKKILKSNKNG